MKPELQVRNLAVHYGDLIGIADVSLDVPGGSIVALIGSNGAGKTTTLNAIAGLIAPASGSIRWQDQEIGRLPAYAVVARGLALSPEGWRLFVNQTVEQNLRLGATVLRDRHPVGRRATDAGHGPRLDVRAETAAPRRAQPRSRPCRGGGAI
jgi:branched-chain amino acid transport system ATP-binding protein